MSWRESAACRHLDTELFFVDYGWVGRPPKSLKKEREAALAICEPVSGEGRMSRIRSRVGR